MTMAQQIYPGRCISDYAAEESGKISVRMTSSLRLVDAVIFRWPAEEYGWVVEARIG